MTIKKIIFLCSCLALVSCDNSYETDGKHPFFIKAENSYSNGRYDEAISFYKKYLDINPSSLKTNYRLATVFQVKNDYIRAIFYYEKYLSLNPKASDKEIIEKWILASKISLAKQLEKYSPSSTKETKIIELANAKRDGEQLKPTLKQDTAQQRTKIPEAKEGHNRNEKQLLNVKYYTVHEGDNFQRISKKFYGSSRYYKLIMEANKITMKGSTLLRIGDKLIIPPLPKSED